MVRDIYNTDKRLARTLELCREDLSKSNYAIVKKYVDFKFALGSKKNNIIKLLTFPRRACGMIDKTISEIQEEDLVKILMNLNAMPVSISTRSGYFISLKVFLNWVLRNRKRKLEKLQTLLKRKLPWAVRTPKFIIEKRHLEAIINATDDTEVKLLCSLLFESGARIGEILNLGKADIHFENNAAYLDLDGKTGKRKIVVIENAPALQKLASLMPEGYIFKHNYASFKKHINKIKKKTGLPELYPHLFRKSWATRMLNAGLPEQIAKKHLGHTPDSKMFKHYSFITSEQASDAILKMHNEVIRPGDLGPEDPRITLGYPSGVRIDPDIMDNFVIRQDLAAERPGRITQIYFNRQLSPFSFSRIRRMSALSR